MNPKTSWELLTNYLRPHRRQVLLLWLTLLATIATQLINPQIIRRFLDAAQAGSALSMLLGAAGIFLAIAVIEQLLGLAVTYLGTNIGWQATNQLSEDVVAHCLTIDREFHKNHSPANCSNGSTVISTRLAISFHNWRSTCSTICCYSSVCWSCSGGSTPASGW